MSDNFPSKLSRMFVTAAVVALLFSLSVAQQAMNAVAKPIAATATDPNVHKWRFDELARDIKALELTRVESLNREAQLERRLGLLESQRLELAATIWRISNPTSSAKKGTTESGAIPASVRAPFTVLDDKGEILFTVDRSPNGGARATVGQINGAAAVLGATANGSFLQLTNEQGAVKVSVLALPKLVGLQAFSNSGFSFIGNFDDNQPVVQIINKSQTAVAELRNMVSGSGQLTLADNEGRIVVVAGATTNGVGVVKTGPAGHGSAATLGNVGLPASQIIGAKQ